MSLFGAEQVYTCLEKVYMVYTTLPPDGRTPESLSLHQRGGGGEWKGNGEPAHLEALLGPDKVHDPCRDSQRDPVSERGPAATAAARGATVHGAGT